MNHSEVSKRFNVYLEGGLPLAERALVDAHLDHCEQCAAELRKLRATVQLLRSLPSPVVPVGLSHRVLERVRAGEGRRRWFDFLVPRFEPGWAEALRFPLAAAAVASVALAVLALQGPPPPGTPSDVRVAQRIPGKASAGPRDVAADEAPLSTPGIVHRLEQAAIHPAPTPSELAQPAPPQEQSGVLGKRRLAERFDPGAELSRVLILVREDPSRWLAELEQWDEKDRELYMTVLAETAAREDVALELAKALSGMDHPRAARWARQFEQTAKLRAGQ
jgi:hypothetical protein